MTGGISEIYPALIGEVLFAGDDVAPRGQKTREILGAQFRLTNPLDNLAVRQGTSSKIAYAEGLQLVCGRSFPELMVRIAPNFANFTDGGTWFHGAYGPRIRHQLETIRQTLSVDESSRQALVTIWDPAYDGHSGTNDTPCTVALQFFNRRGALSMVTTMRSNDIWWGVPYDVFQFTFLQTQLAASLDLSLGEYIHQAGSLHLYERDRERASEVLSCKPWVMPGVGNLICETRRWEHIREVAEAVLRNEDHPLATPTAVHMRSRLHD